MLLFLRHLLAVLLLPFMVVVLLPRELLLHGAGFDARWVFPVVQGVGASCFLAGLALFGWCLALFATLGRGTLAPWDPPLHLVVAGLYRHVRNPMISGVALMLAGEVLVFGSGLLALWLALFLLINQLHFVLVEEPGLERRFGEAYRRYRAAVPRPSPWRA